jgi:hypothetical protein
MFRTAQRSALSHLRRTVETKSFTRHASTSPPPPTAQYHVSKRAVHIGLPLLAFAYILLRVTDPSLAPQSTIPELQSPSCTKIHASDLNKYIKAHPDTLSDEHTLGWNKMYNSFKEHRRTLSEPQRIEEENARLLAQYARAEEIKYRSTKVPGLMATEGGNRSIMHKPELMDEVEASAATFSERISARVAEAKRRFTKASKGINFA